MGDVPHAPFDPLTEAEREASLAATLAGAPADGGFWVFGYGSMLWDPTFEVVASERAWLDGHRRAMCIWTVLARGTLQAPGLGLGLLPAAETCAGVALRVAEPVGPAQLRGLWAREMLTGIYRPRWVSVRRDSGRIDALAFVVDQDHPQFAGDLPPDEAAAFVARASGALGTCRDYLERTVRGLATRGLADPGLEDLLVRVRRLAPLS